MRAFLLLAMLLLCWSVSGSKLTGRITTLIERGNFAKRHSPIPHIWVYFRDKGPSQNNSTLIGIMSEQLHSKTRWRRQKARGITFVDARDLDVYSEYIFGVTSTGCKLRKSSRWLNAISVSVPASSLLEFNNVVQHLASFPYISSIDVMAAYRRIEDKQTPVGKAMHPKTAASEAGIDYGSSYNQLNQINVIAAHALGYNGTGVTVMIADTGYLTSHPAFPMERILGQYDFVQNDTDANDGGNHGTATFSNLGGWDPGEIVGSGFGANFLLAKTEDTTQEDPIEEDNFINALEWGERLGAEVVSASLGYSNWYHYTDMDGTTSPLTVACDIAVLNGVVLVISNGNDADRGISAPADGNYVISVGAVNVNGMIAGFSSLGPSSDGRIKPEVCAQGVQNKVADSTYPRNAYKLASGTSFSCPLMAGVVAILLQAHPDWTPAMVKEALMNTASRHDSPDNTYGWGIVDAVAALNYSPKIGNCEGKSHPFGCCDGQCDCESAYYGRYCSLRRVNCSNACTWRGGVCEQQTNATFQCVADGCGGKCGAGSCVNDAGRFHCECSVGAVWDEAALSCQACVFDQCGVCFGDGQSCGHRESNYYIIIGVSCLIGGIVVAGVVVVITKAIKKKYATSNTGFVQLPALTHTIDDVET